MNSQSKKCGAKGPGSSRGGVPLSNFLMCLGISVSVSLLLGRLTRDYLDLQHSAQSVSPDLSEVHINSSDLLREGLSRSWIIPDIDSEADRVENDDDGDDDEEEEEENLDPIHQLFLDLEKVPEDLIGSADMVAELLEEVVDEFDSQLIAYRCDESLTESITCLGILKGKGHVSIHAWPRKGSVLLDLFIPGVDFMIDDMEDIYEIFHPNMPNQFDSENKFADPLEASVWYLRNRILSSEAISDIEGALGSHEEAKYKVASLKTEFQQVDVVDFQSKEGRVNLHEFKEKAPGYIEAYPHLFVPDRVLFLDGVIQSTLHGNAAYHEALVQPSMFAHPNPKRVAIIGGGECATLREVLKHNTVERVVMIEIDPGVVEASKHALPSWNDCSHFEGSSRYCMDDPRAEIFNEDAFKWFIDRYLGKNHSSDEELFDVIIMDALDPQNVVEFAKALYGDGSFLGALYQALSKDGILITQVGNAPSRGEAPEHLTPNENRVIYSRSLAKQGFMSIADYTEDHTGFEEPWYFYAAFKDISTRENWMASEAEINLKIQKRAIRTIDGTSPFDYFDGATMKMFQYPSQASVDLFCHREPTPIGCDRSSHGFDPERPNYSEEVFNVGSSFAGDFAGRGVFAKIMIPKGSYLMLESTVYPVTIEAPSSSLISKMSYHPIAEDYCTMALEAFAYGYGYPSPSFGENDKIEVESGLMTFVNHGCHGASTLGKFPNITDSTVDPNHFPEDLLFYRMEGEDYIFNPAVVRDTTLRVENINYWGNTNIGDEILENYYEQPPSLGAEWKNHVKNLQNYCSGGVGEVEAYQRGTDYDDEAKLDEIQVQAAAAEVSSMGEITPPVLMK